MVRKNSLLTRSAFTMIELIFAIVIIAIAVMSLPMMTQSTSKGIENNIVQEAIFATSAILNESTTYYWDRHSVDDFSVSGGYSRVVNTGGCSNTVPSRRPGHINRQCLDNNATLPFNGVNNQSVEWVTSIYNNQPIIEGTGTAAATYKDIYNATVSVTPCTAVNTFVQFGLEANNPNLKQIEINITKAGIATPIIILRAYTANIGEVKPKSRMF